MNLPAGCSMGADPNEPCCQKPVCQDPKTPLIPIFQPGSIGHGVVQPPSTSDLFNSSYTLNVQILYTDTVARPTASHFTSKPGIGKYLHIPIISKICIKILFPNAVLPT